MMTPSPDRLYELLPAIHRVRDAAAQYPLRALLRVFDEQLSLVESDIARLYDNWFIETCEDWVVPYIGDLVGWTALHDGSDAACAQGVSSPRIVSPRRDVANTIAQRRRKGTLAVLESLARDVAGWPARAVEMYALLARSEPLNHQRLDRGKTVDLRAGRSLASLGGPFEAAARGVDVRRVASHRTRGRYDIPSVAVFVWRLPAYSVTRAPACCLESQGPHCFTFSVLGHDTALHTLPVPEAEPTAAARPIHLPVPITREMLAERTSRRPVRAVASAVYYGEGKSLAVYAPDWPTKGAPQPIPRESVVPADLDGFQYRAKRAQIAVDPVRGRIVFPTGQLPKRGVWVGYHYAFSADMGGGEYARRLSAPRDHVLYRVAKSGGTGTEESISAALARWRAEQALLGAEPSDTGKKEDWARKRVALLAAVIEIQDSGAYSERLNVELDEGESLQIRARSRARPVLRMLDYVADQPDALRVSGKRGSRFVLEGVVVTGRGVQIVGPDRADGERFKQGDLCDVTLRHVTLVPGWGLECDCEPKRPNEPSLELLYTSARVVVEHAILGSIEVAADEVHAEPIEVRIQDSIVDATSNERSAIGGSDRPFAFASVTLKRSTVFGELSVDSLALAENTIFMGLVRVARRQTGCVRFCYVSPGSRTPSRYRTQPDSAVRAVSEAGSWPSQNARRAAEDLARSRVRPLFNSVRYGAATYAQLACACAEEIRRGAEDEAEMGAFHDLLQPQREANLVARLTEFTPGGMESGVLFAS
jgi:hypothetical protein